MRPSDFLQLRVYDLILFERTVRDDSGAGGPVQPIRAPAANLARSVPGVEIHCLDRHACRDWACEHSSDGDWAQYRTALLHSHDLLLARRAGRTVGWAWLGYTQVFLPPLGRALELPPGSAYLYDAYVRPEARRQGIGQALVAARCQRARERGVELLWTHVLTGNVASQRALELQGFAARGRVRFLKALGLGCWVGSPLPDGSATVRATVTT